MILIGWCHQASAPSWTAPLSGLGPRQFGKPVTALPRRAKGAVDRNTVIADGGHSGNRHCPPAQPHPRRMSGKQRWSTSMLSSFTGQRSAGAADQRQVSAAEVEHAPRCERLGLDVDPASSADDPSATRDSAVREGEQADVRWLDR